MGSSQETIERASRLVGKMLRDKWRLDALIGVGGMAAVYAATHRNGKRAAIKLLNRDLSEGDSTKARFLREGYVANKVGHPGVVNVLDDDTSDDGRAFLVMELLEGETLKTRWNRWKKRMPVDEVLRITHAVLDVLATAHDKGIIHRDIKPENIFLTNDGVVKVLDFGIARLRENSGEAADATRSSAMLGTPAFMAPEQARSRWEWVDARTDVWAVGATMFTTLSGQLVHEAMTVTELLVQAAMTPARPIRSLMPELPEGVAGIVDRALAFDQAHRWPDARAMQAAIGFALNSKGAAPPTTQPMSQVTTTRPQGTTTPMPVQNFDEHPVAVAPPAPTSHPKTAPILASPAAPPPGPPSQLQPMLGHSQPGQMQSPLQAAFPSAQPPMLGHSQPGQMQTPLPGAISQPPLAPDPPGVSTLVTAATASATLTATRAMTKTNPFILPAVGGIFALGLIAAFFILRSGGDTESNETSAATTPAAAIDLPVPSSSPSVALIAENPPTVPEVEPVASVEPEASATTKKSSTSRPRQTNTTKPRTTPTGTKKRDPFDKY